jgi:hypothetical protein
MSWGESSQDYKDRIRFQEQIERLETEEKQTFNSHYQYSYKGIKLDPYRIMHIYNITHPAQQQALKKVLRAGASIKNLKQDIDETIEALERWKAMILEDEQEK